MITASWHMKYKYVLLFLIVSLSSVLAFLYIGKNSFWFDEICSVTYASNNWKELWRIICGYEANQGLYYILLKLWMFFGQDEFTVRSLSAIFAIGSVPFIYSIGSHLFDTRSGLVSALIIATNSFFIEYCQEARGYSLLVLLTTISSFFFIKTVEQPSWKAGLGYVVSSVLAVYVHFFAILVLMAHALSLISVELRTRRWGWLITSYITIGILLTPIGIFILTKDTGQIDWITKPEIKDVYYFLRDITGGGRAVLTAYFVACFIFAIFAARSCLENGRSILTWRHLFLLSWLLVPIITAYVVSISNKPIFRPRYLIIALPCLALIAGSGVSRLKNKYVFSVIMATFVALSLQALFTSYYPKPKADWRDATSFVVSKSKPGDAIIFYPKLVISSYQHYRNKVKVPDNIMDRPYPHPIFGDSEVTFSNKDLDLLKSTFRSYKRIWFVIATEHIHINDNISNAIIMSINASHRLELEKRYAGIHLMRYQIDNSLRPRLK